MSELKENEICIGNYLMELTSNDIFIVSSSWFSCIDVNILCSRPIPLTEEWLLNFGFLQSMALTNYWSEDEEMNIFVDDKGIHYAIPLDHDGNFWKIKKLEYVHQLQNFYHSLTGKELTHQKIN